MASVVYHKLSAIDGTAYSVKVVLTTNTSTTTVQNIVYPRHTIEVSIVETDGEVDVATIEHTTKTGVLSADITNTVNSLIALYKKYFEKWTAIPDDAELDTAVEALGFVEQGAP